MKVPIQAGLFVLNGRTVVPCTDLLEWGKCFDDHEGRRVAKTRVGPYDVSTVFLGVDHDLFGEGRLFETMVFGPPSDNNNLVCRRYATWEQAERGHQEIVDELTRKTE